ncbi:hypothetical protein V9T40_011300 [Parthenolecanium corni]|uniref:L27 domain-containing protein n=1 Tax=Parthenolecanium corni TaxID=536013 RepID=A0AAN9XYF9_9HEMI
MFETHGLLLSTLNHPIINGESVTLLLVQVEQTYCKNIQCFSGSSNQIEAHRALELLEDYHAKLVAPQDKNLRIAIERVIRIFKSRLFQALLGLGDPAVRTVNMRYPILCASNLEEPDGVGCSDESARASHHRLGLGCDGDPGSRCDSMLEAVAAAAVTSFI